MGLTQWSKSHRKEYGWVPPFPVVSLICLFCHSLCPASGLLSWLRGLRRRRCFPGLSASGEGRCSQVLEEKGREEKDGLSQESSRKAPGGLERSDSICSDVQLQIFMERKRGEGWEESIHPTAWVQVLIWQDICWGHYVNKLMSCGGPPEGKLLQDPFSGGVGPPLAIRRPLPFQSCYPRPRTARVPVRAQ